MKPPPRRDYAVFLNFEALGTQQKTEIAITGSALPVLLKSDPSHIDFTTCVIGQKKDLQITITNESELKEVKFKFRKIANFTVYPASGRIQPRSSLELIVSFIPHQIGKSLRVDDIRFRLN